MERKKSGAEPPTLSRSSGRGTSEQDVIREQEKDIHTGDGPVCDGDD